MPNFPLTSRSTPAEISAVILEMVPNCPRQLNSDEPAAERSQRLTEIKKHDLRLSELKYRMVKIFGTERGWKPARSWFNVKQLAGTSRRKNVTDDWPRCYADHAYFYTKSGEPVAVVAHLYDISPSRPGGVYEWAAREGIRASFPEFPSWWYPGRTSLILFERA